jgi:hypothetical protein
MDERLQGEAGRQIVEQLLEWRALARIKQNGAGDEHAAPFQRRPGLGCWLGFRLGSGGLGFGLVFDLGGGGGRLGGLLLQELVHALVQLIDALVQIGQILVAGHAQGVQCTGYAVLEHLLELVPGFSRFAGNGHNFLLCRLAALFLDLLAGFDQVIESLHAFTLGLGESAQAGQPDLVGGFEDDVGVLLLFGGFLQRLGHGGLLGFRNEKLLITR